MDMKLEGKVALVTGSSQGIGKGIALGLAAEGCHVVMCARGREVLEAAAEEVRRAGEARGAEAVALEVDVTEEGASERLVGAAEERFGRLDAVVLNVGGNRRKPFVETTDQDWADLLELNFLSHVRTARRALALLPEAPQPNDAEGGGEVVDIDRHGGVILFISSIFGREAGGPDLTLYNTTKSALISLAKIMALELAPKGIRVNSVAPGSILFEGGGWHQRLVEKPEMIAEFIASELPSGRFGRVEEVADLVTFLCSPRASLITGTCFNADGGQSRSLI